MADQRVVRIRYTSQQGAISHRDVEPMLFASTNGQWYLIAWCRLRSAVRWFVMARIQKASITSEPCTGHDTQEIGKPPPTARSVATPHA